MVLTGPRRSCPTKARRTISEHRERAFATIVLGTSTRLPLGGYARPALSCVLGSRLHAGVGDRRKWGPRSGGVDATAPRVAGRSVSEMRQQRQLSFDNGPRRKRFASRA